MKKHTPDGLRVQRAQHVERIPTRVRPMEAEQSRVAQWLTSTRIASDKVGNRLKKTTATEEFEMWEMSLRNSISTRQGSAGAGR